MRVIDVTPARIDPPARPLPLIQLLRTVVRNPLEAWPSAVYQEHLYRSRVLGRDAIYVMHPALIRQVLVDDADSFDKGEMARRALEPVLGDAILTSDGARWRWQRRAAAPVFRPEHLRGFLPSMIAAAERTRDRWLSLPRGAEIDVAREMMQTTFDIVLETTLSGRSNIDTAAMERAIADYLEFDIMGDGAGDDRRAPLGSISRHRQGTTRARASAAAGGWADHRRPAQPSCPQ